jgi:hypothetical protein
MELTLAGQAVLGPGLPDWPAARAVLCGAARYEVALAPEPAPELLPANERRRASSSARWALTVGRHALGVRLGEAGEIATVFSSCGGDGQITHQICEVLAGSERAVSPTAFHNSVHNAPAGYWSIATRSRAPSTSLCGHGGSFAAGLIEAATQVVVDGRSVLLVAYDLPYPEPMHSLWPIPNAFAVALLLDPAGAEGIRLTVTLRSGAAQISWPATLPRDLAANPAAHALALLEGPARGERRRVTLPLHGDSYLAVEVG